MPKVLPMMFLVASMGAFATGCAAPPPSGAPASEVAAAQSKDARPEDEVVCKEIRKTGTRFGTRQCLTVAQWEALRRGSQEGVSEVQRRASQQQDMPGQAGSDL